MKIFVYGTLKRNKRAFHLMEAAGAEFIREATTAPKYHLKNLGGFPGLVMDESVNYPVHGEVFEVDENRMQRLDSYEGVDRYNPQSGLFRKQEIELSDGETVTAYMINRYGNNCEIVEDGIWS